MTESTPATSITDAESVVMEVLWRYSTSAPTETVVAALEGEQRWQEATIKTLLNRLLKKKVIRAQKDGRRFLYSPLIMRDQWAATSFSTPIEIVPPSAGQWRCSAKRQRPA
jgi:BlaI family penicillinase repressor